MSLLVGRAEDINLRKKTFAYGVASDQGAWPVQEDGFFIDPRRGFFSLLDGFGGKAAGDLTVKKTVEEIRKQLEEMNVSSSGPYSKQGQWQRYVFFACNKILLEWNKERDVNKKGGCSLLVGNIDKHNILSATNLGSCGLWLLRAGVFHQFLTPQVSDFLDENSLFLPDQGLGLMVDLLPETRSMQLFAGDILIGLTSELGKNFSRLKENILERASVHEKGADFWSNLAEELVSLDSLKENKNKTGLFLEIKGDPIDITEDFSILGESTVFSEEFDPL